MTISSYKRSITELELRLEASDIRCRELERKLSIKVMESEKSIVISEYECELIEVETQTVPMVESKIFDG